MGRTINKKRGEIRSQSAIIMPEHVELKLIEERDALPSHVPLRNPFEEQLPQNRGHGCGRKPMTREEQKEGGKL